MNKPELLAPAGDINRLKWALDYGADAVYIGGYNYSLRANANNFSIDEIKESCIYAHEKGKKVYVTVNMIFHSDEIDGLNEYLKKLEDAKVDGIMISDIAVISIMKKNNINIPIYISTQMSTTNYETAKFWESLGAKRVVLARECSREDIIDIKKNTNLEVEIFIHGAMCTSYSGRCVMSNYVTLRDSNRGGCSQVCRFNFNIDNNDNIFAMSSKDLNMIDYIADMMKLGIDSFKIEGRMKSLYYIATVTDAYRKIIDKNLSNNLTPSDIEYYKRILNRCSNRENAPQFYDKYPKYTEQYFQGREEVSNQDFLGIISEYDEKKSLVSIEQRNYFKVGDEIEIFGPNTECFSYIVNTILNEKDEPVDAARHPQEKLKINVPKIVYKGDIIRVKIL